VLRTGVTIAHQLALSLYAEGSVRTPPRSSAPCRSLPLAINSVHSSPRVFTDLRTLSFSVSHLSRVLPASCALSAKYRGYTHTWSYQVAPASCRQAFRLASEPAGCRRYPSTERDGQAHPLQILPTPSFPLHTKTNLVCPLFPIHTQQDYSLHKRRGMGV